ncbi:MAG TPA: acyl-CoA thioesterase [Anaeromyxobacteraceae bacterium]|nr:acyl-CoA thioesterase [Anaeromyxobacteraceae bacterium]
MPEQIPKPPGASRVEMTELVMPTDANNLGSAFGGRIVQWMDLAGAVAARRHARMPVVTVAIDQLTFLAPVRLGHVAVLRAQVNAAFGTSMEVEVEVLDEDPDTGLRRRCCDGFLTFVALGPDRRPARVPPLELLGEEESQRERDAHDRRARRLASRPPRRAP